MTEMTLKNNTIGLVTSFFITGLLNIPIQYMFQHYLVIPYVLLIVSFILEWLIVFEISKIVLNIWKSYDKYIISFVYFVLLVSILLIRYEYGYSVLQLNPFACFREVYYGSYKEWCNFLFNIIAFIPLPLCFRVYTKDWIKVICCSFLVGVCIELIQLFSQRGIFDTGDILLYSVGVFIGYFLTSYLENKKNL